MIGKIGKSVVMGTLALALASGLSLTAVSAQSDCQPQVSAPTNAQLNLDDSVTDWGVYCENAPEWEMQNVAAPSTDGTALECAITGGDPYSNVHCYRNLLPEAAAAMFTMDMVFWFSETTCNNDSQTSIVQALEFTMNKWHDEVRYEFAVQWQNVGPGAPQWRYWDGSQLPAARWVAFNPPIEQCLVGGDDQPHYLRIEGAIVSGQISLSSFTIDNQAHDVALTLPAIADTGAPDKLVAAVQVDGNEFHNPYRMVIDKVDFVRWPGLLVLAQPADHAVLVSEQPVLAWNSVAGAVRYEVELGQANSAAAAATVSTNQYTPPGKLPPGDYYWRVRAVDNQNHLSPWTPPRLLTLQSPAGSVPELYHLDTSPITLTWSAVDWATAYEIQVDENRTFPAPLLYTTTTAANKLEAIISVPPAGQYYWRVRAQRANGTWGNWSAVSRFSVS